MSRKNRNKNKVESETNVDTTSVQEQVETPHVNEVVHESLPSRASEDGMDYNWDANKESPQEEDFTEYDKIHQDVSNSLGDGSSSEQLAMEHSLEVNKEVVHSYAEQMLAETPALGEVVLTPRSLDVVQEPVAQVEQETTPVEAAVAVQELPKEEIPEILPYEPPANRITEQENRLSELPKEEELPTVDVSKMEPLTPPEEIVPVRQPANPNDWYDVLDKSVGLAPAPVKVEAPKKQSGIRAAVLSALNYEDQSSKDLRAIVPGLTADNFPQSWLKKLSEETPPKVVRSVQGDHTVRYRLPRPAAS